MRPRVNYNLVKKEKKCPKRERRVYNSLQLDKTKKISLLVCRQEEFRNIHEPLAQYFHALIRNSHQ